VIDGPWSYGMLGEHPLAHKLGLAEAARDGTLHSNRPVYRPIGARWAARLEAYCRIYDRAAGQDGAGILWLLEDLLAWHPADGAPSGAGRSPYREGIDPGWPASLAFFIARLGREAKRLRRERDPRRRMRSLWHIEDGELERRARRYRDDASRVDEGRIPRRE
jgi:hypothetical protein